jgi:hypothetical protein
MRRWFTILMLFLLPLRGLMGDAMAYSMLPMQLQAPVPVVAQATDNSRMPCHEASKVAQDGSAPDTQQQCTSCQVCHLLAAYPLQAAPSLPQIAAAAPSQHAFVWRSADLRLTVKPPVL